ncbi:DNA breaking-rejoining protein [Stenotrophomonas sp. Br8]|uniref:DNA breaking-rejoining protein n=1 Tax=Stenotrophomonas sp. Br8 TaxID=2759658 RepID=UPI00168AC5C8|nr:DNA breaking-rejoining protein [Stenotrophomonas sp. Br8]MBD3682204.1 DNA breaking-rejoining protein [Stenotrophomonas sp. Br8]
MKKIMFLTMLGMIGSPFSILAQTNGSPAAQAKPLTSVGAAELKSGATGRQFSVGRTQFQLVPSAAVQRKNGGELLITPSVTPGTSSAPPSGSRTKRSTDTPASAAGSSSGKLAAAVSPDGAPIVVTSSVNLYFSDEAAVKRAAQVTSGKVAKVSTASGKAVIEYTSVDSALDAVSRLKSVAGVIDAEPAVVQWTEVK